MNEPVDQIERVDLESASVVAEGVVPDQIVDQIVDEPVDGTAEDSAEGSAEDTAVPLDPATLLGALEAILFVLDNPVTEQSLGAALQVPVAQVQQAVATLRAGYDERGAGIELRETAGGLRIYTRPEFAPQVEAFLQDGQRAKLSQAALETLAVIAYRQPVTRSRVSAIRGVNVDGVVRTLLARGLILEMGVESDSGASLFRTSELFLERMGLQSLDELPSLAPLLPDLASLDQDEL